MDDEFEFSKINEIDEIYQEAVEYCKKDDIDTKINKYHQILNEIRKLKSEIEKTNFISINDLEDLDNEIKEREGEIKRREDEIKDEIKEREDEIKIIKGKGRDEIKIIKGKGRSKFRARSISNIMDSNYPWLKKISDFTNSGNRYITKYYSVNYKLVALQIIKYNLEKKKRLKEIYHEYHSEEDINNNLQKIYLHQIKSLI